MPIIKEKTAQLLGGSLKSSNLKGDIFNFFYKNSNPNPHKDTAIQIL